MSDLSDQLGGDLEQLRADGLYRTLRTIASAQGPRIVVEGREFLNFSSNDYLGLANDPILKSAATTAVEKYGVGAGASRLVCGNIEPYALLEERLARFKRKEAALVFGSGYAANVGTIGALVGKGDVIILDKLDHASIIDGARQSGAAIRVYPHCDVRRLQEILEWAVGAISNRDRSRIQFAPTKDRPARILIVTETVFSMDGDLAPLAEIVALKEKYGAWLMIDEAHATGLYAEHRRGIAEAAGVEDKIDVTLGTLSKALGCAGGFVVGSQTLVDYLRNRARSLIYSTALSPAIVSAAAAAVDFVMSEKGQERRDQLWRNVSEMKNGLSALGLQNESRSPIIPIILGDEATGIETSAALYERGIFVPAIRFPTVPKGMARLRVTMTAAHTLGDVRRFLGAVDAIFNRDSGGFIDPIAASAAIGDRDSSMTMTSLADKDHHFIWHPFTQMKEWMQEEPLIIESGQGTILRDTTGNEYIDANSSIWTVLHGHRHPKITQAIKEQLDRIAHSSFLGLSNVPAIELAEKLISLAPRSNARTLSRVFYSDDGSTAMEVAIKMALQYWQHRQQPRRKKFVAFADAYHGDTLGAVSIGGIELFHATFKPLTFDVLRVGKMEECRDMFERHAGEIAAVAIEPLIQGAGGMKLWPCGLLADLRRLCDEHEALLIADEVMTGFGRTGTMFACEQEAVAPDLMALAKGLTGGYLPLAATLATGEVFDAFLGEYAEVKTFFHGHSYTGNQLGCAAALANLRIFEEERTLEKISVLSRQLSVGMGRLRALPHVVDVRCLGGIAAVEIGPYPIKQKMGIKVCVEMRRRGVLTRPLGNTIPIMPPYCVTARELDAVLTALAESVQVVCGP